MDWSPQTNYHRTDFKALDTRTVIDKEFLPIQLSIRKLPIRYFDSIRIDKNSNYLKSLILTSSPATGSFSMAVVRARGRYVTS